MATSADNESNESPSIRLVEKKNTTAKVWKYFGIRVDDNGQVKDINSPTCKLCLCDVPAAHGNTTNLLSHMKNNHTAQYLEVKPCGKSNSSSSSDKSQSTINDCILKTKLISTSSSEHRRITDGIARCLAKDMIPISTVDKCGFREMVKRLNPRYQLPHKDHFSRHAIPTLYAETRDQVEQKLNKDMVFFSATADLWSSCTVQPYLGFTVQFINSSWELESCCLQVHYMPENHTGENIQHALASTLQDWGLDETRLTSITTDSGSNIILACRLLGWTRLSCFGHNLDLAVRKGFDDQRVSRVLRLCRQIVAAFAYSWKRTKELHQTLEQKGIPIKKLRADVSTRWGSTIFMVKRIKEQIDAIRTVLSNDRKASHLVPTWQDSDVIDSLIAAIEPLEEITDLLSGEKRVTSSAIKPLLKHLVSKVLIGQESDTTLTRQIKSVIKQDLQSRYEDEEISNFLDICSLLDPRFKSIFTFESEVAKIVRDLSLDVLAENESPIPLSAEPAEEPPSKKGKFRKIFGDDFQNETTDCGASTPLERVKQEMAMYFQLPVMDIDENPLSWWKHESIRMPLLSQLAKKYLCSSATSVASERSFSTAGNVITSNRSLLKPEKANQLIFLAKNLD